MAEIDDRIRGNVKKLISAGAPESDIDAYLQSEGVSSVQQPEQPKEATVAQRGKEFAGGANIGLSQTLGLPVDAVAGVLRYFGVDPGQTPIGGSAWMQENIMPETVEPTDATGRVIQRVGQEFGAAAPVAGLGLAKTLATAPANIARQEAANLAKQEAATTLASGTAAGLGQEIAGDTGEIIGQVAGAFGPAAVQGGIRRTFRGKQQPFQENVETFRRAGATPSVAQASGSRTARGAETILSKSPGGGKPFADAAQAAQEGIRNQITKIADDLASARGPEVAGRAIQRGARTFAKDFSARAKPLYDRLDQYIPDTYQVKVSNTARTLDDLTAKIQGAEALSSGSLAASPKIVKIQQDFAKDTAGGVLPYQALKQMRSRVGELLNTNELLSGAPKAEVKRLYAAISRDMEEAAKQRGPKAMQAFSRANKYWKSGRQRIDDVLDKAFKQNEPEKLYKSIESGSKEGATRLRAIMRSLKPEERELVSSTFISRLGRSTGRFQDELGEAFSTETFLTNWNKISPEAKSSLTGGTKKLREYAKNLDDIAKTSRMIRESTQALANPSGTASQSANIFAEGAGSIAVITGHPEYALYIGVYALGNRAAGNLMTSPKFVNWLAKSIKIPPEKLPGYVAKLNASLQGEDEATLQAADEYISQLIGGENGATD